MVARAPIALVARWITWSQASANRRILAAAITVGGLTLLANLVIVTKDLIVVYRFGASDALDALLIAWLRK